MKRVIILLSVLVGLSSCETTIVEPTEPQRSEHTIVQSMLDTLTFVGSLHMERMDQAQATQMNPYPIVSSLSREDIELTFFGFDPNVDFEFFPNLSGTDISWFIEGEELNLVPRYVNGLNYQTTSANVIIDLDDMTVKITVLGFSTISNKLSRESWEYNGTLK